MNLLAHSDTIMIFGAILQTLPLVGVLTGVTWRVLTA